MTRLAYALSLACLLAAANAPASAQSPASANVTLPAATVIGARQAAFAFMAGNFDDINAAAKAGTSPKGFADAADEIGQWAALIPSMFPPGTETGNDTKVLPAAFSDRAGFAAKAAALGKAAAKLKDAAAADDAKAFAAAFKATGAACGACHKAYRAKD